jgi:hypothetical protein
VVVFLTVAARKQTGVLFETAALPARTIVSGPRDFGAWRVNGVIAATRADDH